MLDQYWTRTASDARTPPEGFGAPAVGAGEEAEGVAAAAELEGSATSVGDADGAGPGNAAVVSGECGAGYAYNTTAAASFCTGTACNVLNIIGDRAACCFLEDPCAAEEDDCVGDISVPAGTDENHECAHTGPGTHACSCLPGSFGDGRDPASGGTACTACSSQQGCEVDTADTCLTAGNTTQLACSAPSDGYILSGSGSTSTAVPRAACGDAELDCGPGFLLNISASEELCQGAACNVAGVLADKAACCVARATCGDADGPGPGFASVSDADCGPGRLYDPSASSTLCRGTACDISGVPDDLSACCVAQATCGDADGEGTGGAGGGGGDRGGRRGADRPVGVAAARRGGAGAPVGVAARRCTGK